MTRAARIAQVLLVLAIGVILWMALSANPPGAAGLFDFDKLNHLAAFFILALLAEYAFPSATISALKLLPLLGFGLLIEVLQYWVGYRYFEWLDVAADGAGIVLFWVIRGTLRRTVDPLIQKALGA
ncbi:VanZ family protein [Pseudomonadales bacterium]|nr:VanZ family protein [Pseudomonadales bacterium]